MARISRGLLVLLISGLALFLASGNGGKTAYTVPKPARDDPDPEILQPLEVRAVATLRGKVTYEGNSPKPGSIADRNDFKKNLDAAKCKGGDLATQQWKVAADSGVSNVVIFLRPPRNRYFQVPPAAQKTWPDVVQLGQPFCAFEPHVFWVYPMDYRKRKTGQKFYLVNNSNFAHNTKWAGNSRNPGDNKLFSPGDELVREFRPSGTPIEFQCSIHPWMNAWGWVFDHPYVDVSKDGNYEIKNVPAGVKLRVVAWHEAANGGKHYVLPELRGSSEGQEIELTAHEIRELNFKIKQ